MIRLPECVIGSLALCLTVSADTVFTRDGHIHRGKISLGTNNTVRVVAPGTTNVVTATNLLRAVFGATATKPGFLGVTFKLYQGNWKTLPDFSQMPVTQSGQLTTNRLDLTPLGPQSGAQRVFDLKPNQLLERLDSPQVKGRPITITATITPSAKDGVILAQGGYMDGYALYLQGGRLTFATLINHKISVAQDTKPLPLNRPTGVNAQLWRDGTLVLTVDGRQAAKVTSPGTMIRMPFEGLSVGHDHKLPMTPLKGENRFQGTLKNLRVSLSGAALVYSGTLHVKTTGPYQFSLVADAASRLEIDGQILVDNTDPKKPAQPWGTVDLAVGAHNFKLTYAQLLPAQPVPGKAVQPQVISNVDKPWIEDKLPAGVVFTQGPFEFVTAPAPVYSGARSLKLSAPKKVSAYFNSDRHINKNIEPLMLAEGDRLYAYAYLDSKDPPESILMQWHDNRGWEHRAYWGQNLFDNKDGAHNTMRLWPMGPLPAAGKWARLEVPAIAVGFAPGSPWPSIHGWGFQVAGGTVYFDQCGTANPITVPPGDNKHLSLNWFGPGTIDHALTAVPHPAARTWLPDDKAIPSAGIMTWDGSFIPQQVKKVDGEKVYYSNTGIARLNVSTIFLRPLSIVEANKLRNKPTGVLLMNGDFIEGALNSLDDKLITISSVLFGLKNYKPNEEAIAVVLKSAIKPVSRHHFKLRDGSRIFAKKFKIKGAQIILSAPPFQGRTIPFSQVSEMTYGHLPSLLQASTIHWENLSGLGRQLLETRDRENLSIVQQHEDWRARLTDAGKVTAEANKELPPLVKAETDAQTAKAKALSLRDAARQKVTAKTQAHAQSKTALTAARSKLDSDCHQIDLKSEALANLISTGQNPKLQILAHTQRKSDSVSLAHMINARDLIEIQAEITLASTAQKAAESAVKASVANITAFKAKLTASATALAAAEKDLQPKQKAAADAHTTLTNALKSSLQPAFKQMAASNREFVDAGQRQAKAEQKIRQLNIATQMATANFQGLDNETKTAVTAVTSAKTKTTTVTTGVTTATTKLTTATNAVKNAKQTLESLQKTQLYPAIDKAEAAESDLTLTIQATPKADQLLADMNKVVAQAMKTMAEANKLAQTKFEPEQVKKDLVATLALAEQLKILTAAARAPIDDINATRKTRTLAIGLAATNSLVTAMANKKTADQTMVTLKENIAKATTVHANAENAAVAAEAKAKIALSLATAATNTLSVAMKDFESKQSAAATMQKTMVGKFTALQQATQAAGTTRKVVIQANFIKSRAGPTALAAKTRLTKATDNSTAAGDAGKNATATASAAKTLYTAANSTLTTAKSNVNKKKSAANTARNALATLAKKQTPANAKTAMAHKKYVRAQLAHSAAQQSLAAATNKVEMAKGELQKIEQRAKDTKDEDKVAALKRQVTEAKQVLSRLTNVRQKQSASKVTATLAALAKAKNAKDAADKALTALNVQVTIATTAAHKTAMELAIATAQLNAAQAKLDQATVNQRLANVRSTSTQSGIATAKQVLTEATTGDKAAKALVTVTTTAATKAGIDRITTGKTLITATQQATASTMAHRASVKVQAEADTRVKMAKENVDKAAKNLEAEKPLAPQQRTFADKAKRILDELSTSQQKNAKDTVTAAAAAITKAQADVASANQALKAIEMELTALAPTLLLMNQTEAAAMTLINTLGGGAVTEVKLTAEKKALMDLTRKAMGSYVNVHQKGAMAKATAANTALTQAKANKTAADKASTMIKLKAADAVTVLQKAEQVLRDAEAGIKTAEIALAKAQEEQAMAEKLTEETTKQTAGAKASLTQLTTEQKLAVTAATTAKAGLTKAMADQVKVNQALNAANKAIITMMLSRKTAKKAVQDSEEKMLAARIASEKLSKELTILELQATAWREKAARVGGGLARLKALWHSPATRKATSLSTASTQALTNRGNAEKALAAANLAVATQELARRAAIEVGLTSDGAELKAQQVEGDGWKELVLAKQEAEQAETDYMKTVEDYRARKQEADAVRGKLSKAQAETNLSNTNLARLKPAYDSIIRP